MKAVVPAAGDGTRLRPLTSERPKGLVDVAGKPLLEHVLDVLVNSGIDTAILVVGYEGTQIVDHFGSTYGRLSIQYVQQGERLGLADAVLQARDLIDHRFLVLNGDNVFVDGLGGLPHLDEAECDGALLVEGGSTDDVREAGAVDVDTDGVARVVEKPEKPSTHLMTTGCYLLPPAIMDTCREIDPSPRGEYELADAINGLIDMGHLIVPVEYTGWRRNVNTPRDIAIVESYLESTC